MGEDGVADDGQGSESGADQSARASGPADDGDHEVDGEEGRAAEGQVTAGRVPEKQAAEAVDLRDEVERLAGDLERLRDTVADSEQRIGALETRLEDYRRRGEREREQLAARAVEDLAERMLRVKDTVDAVVGMEDLDGDGARRVELLARQFETEFTAGDIDRIETDGAFDARRHKMIDRVATDDVPDGEIVRELEAGYAVGDRVLRPARVVVATGAASDGDGTPDDVTEATE